MALCLLHLHPATVTTRTTKGSNSAPVPLDAIGIGASSRPSRVAERHAMVRARVHLPTDIGTELGSCSQRKDPFHGFPNQRDHRLPPMRFSHFIGNGMDGWNLHFVKRAVSASIKRELYFFRLPFIIQPPHFHDLVWSGLPVNSASN